MSFLLLGCATVQTTATNGNVPNTQEINIELKEGITTQAETIRMLGRAEITKRTSNGVDIWTYQRYSLDTYSRGTNLFVKKIKSRSSLSMTTIVLKFKSGLLQSFESLGSNSNNTSTYNKRYW